MIPHIDPTTSYFGGINQIRIIMNENFRDTPHGFCVNANEPKNLSFKRISQVFLANGAFFIENAGKTVLGVVMTPLAIFGTRNFSEDTSNFSAHSTNLLSMPFLMTLKCIRSNSPIIQTSSQPSISPIAMLALIPILLKARELSGSTHWFKKQICTRVLYAVSGVTAVITQLADLAIGLCAATLALITLGKFQTLNTYAFRSLCGTGVIETLSIAIRGTFRPVRVH